MDSEPLAMDTAEMGRKMPTMVLNPNIRVRINIIRLNRDRNRIICINLFKNSLGLSRKVAYITANASMAKRDVPNVKVDVVTINR